MVDERELKSVWLQPCLLVGRFDSFIKIIYFSQHTCGIRHYSLKMSEDVLLYLGRKMDQEILFEVKFLIAYPIPQFLLNLSKIKKLKMTCKTILGSNNLGSKYIVTNMILTKKGLALNSNPA